jgi:peroxiredoxin
MRISAMMVVAVASSLVGCKPAPGASASPDPGAGDAATLEGQEPAPDEALAIEQEPGDPEPVETASTTEGTAQAVPPDAETKPPAEPEPKAAPPSLPKPLHAKRNASCGKDSGVGQKLQAFDLATTDGKQVTHRSYGGRVLVVNFWGTWCKPCLKELPEFDRVYRRYRNHGLTLVAIATDEDGAPVREFIAKRKLAAKVLIGGEAYANKYASPTFPFTFIVDPRGVIRASYRGYKPECLGEFEADVREQLEAR